MRKKYLYFVVIVSVFLMFSARLRAQAPGGVNTNLKLWLKANAGVTLSGSGVSTWADQSGGGFNATQVTVAKRPAFTTSSPLFNGNPSVNFDLTDDAMATTASIVARPYSFFVVYNSTSTSGVARRAVQGSNNWLIGPYNNNANFYAGNWVGPGNVSIGTKPILNTALSSSAATGNASFYSDGKLVSAAGGVSAGTAPGTIHLGSSGAAFEPMGGSIAEVIAYTATLNAADQNKVESYLAIKYGITLDQTVAKNYVNSTGAVWYPSASTHTAYVNNVVGIGRDDGAGLDRTISKSVNAGALLAIESPTVLNNGDYLVSGDDGANVNSRSSDAPAGYGQRLQRVWRVSKSANPATVTIRMFVGDLPELMSNPDLANVALLKNSTSSFAAATPVTGAAFVVGSNDTIEFTGVSLNDGDYLSLSMGNWAIPATFDFEYWYGVPRWSIGYNSPQKLHFTGVSATQYATYVIDMPADPSFTPIVGTVVGGGSKIIDMSSFVSAITVQPANTIVNRGLRVRVMGQMGAYYANERGDNYGTMPLRGPNGLGTSFIIPGQDTFANGTAYPNARALFVVTATEDNTWVTITPSQAITGHGANVPFTITLNKGQSYSADAVATTGNHLGGSFVESSLPVVVTYSDELLYFNGAADNAGDQLVPVSRLGKDYAHIRANLIASGELAYIFGTEDGTTVTIFDGTTTSTLVVNKGTFVKHLLPAGINAASIKTDKPVMVYKMGGVSTELGGGILTPVADCKGTSLVAYQYPSSANQAIFSFVAPDAIVGNFLLNGSSSVITAADFIAIPGIPGWKYARKTVTGIFARGQIIKVENTAGKFYFYQNIYSDGGGGGDYSNFSDFGNVVLFPKADHVCGSNTIMLNSGAIAYNTNIQSYSWTGPNGFTSTIANPAITNLTAAGVGRYTVTVTDEKNCTYTESVMVDLAVDAITLTPTPSSPCVGSSVQFTSVAAPSGAVPASILWTGPNGFTSTQANFEITGITAAQAGTYTCTYVDKYGCTVSNSTTISVSTSVLSTFTIGGEYKISCDNPSVTLSVTGFTPGIKYETFNPYDASSLFASSNFTVVTPGFYSKKPGSTGIATQLNLSGLTGVTGSSTAYGVKYKGFINITTAGNYTFYTNSKDGSTLSIDGSTLINNDGSHTLTEVASTAVNLSVGYHAITVNYFNGSAGAAALSVSYSGPSIAKQVIPASVLFYAGGAAPALTYDWSTGDMNTSTITVSTPGTYTVTGSNGGCSSVASFEVMGIDSYDYSDLTAPWPVAQAKITNCLVSGVPTGTKNSVWAGTGISYEGTPLRNAMGSADTFDDGLIKPAVSSDPYGIVLSSNTPGATVNYGLWFDWNNNGDFADDVDANGNPAFYNGSGTAGQTINVPVLPPVGVSQYKTRLIVADIPIVFTAYDDIFDNGEVEDYNSVLSLTGTVFADKDGLNGTPANTVNGTGTNAGGLTAVLVNGAGKVVANSAVATNGTYNFASLTPDTYSIVLSTTLGTVAAAPPGASLPPGWVNTGENLGVAAGHDGIVNGILANIVVNTNNISNANFGINSRPTADPVSACLKDPGSNTRLIVPVLTGSDPEEGTYTGISNSNRVTILTLPGGATLYYNGAAVTAGQVISNYNPSLLQLDPDAGTYAMSFTYNEIDAAGSASLSATVTLSTVYAGADQGIPSNGTATLAASGTGVWSAQAGNPSVISFTSATDPAATTSNFTVDGIYHFIWTNSNGCTDTIKITVPIPPIDAVDDDFTAVPINQRNGGATSSVLNNDSLNGTTVNSGNIILTPLGVPPGLTMNPDGTIAVAAGVPVGTYVVTYRICEAINPSTNCDAATATLVVQPAVIDAVADDYTGVPINGINGGTTASVLTNDMLNGIILTPSDVTLSAVTVPTGFTLNANGSIAVPAGTPAGNYVLTYRICENLNPGNCDIAQATVFVFIPSIVLVKTAVVGGTGAVGDVVSYTFTATNTGNVTLSGVNITDALTGSTALALSPAVLAPGASGTATASYTIRQSDIDAGKVSNTATVTGTAPDASTVSDVSGTAQNNDTPTDVPLSRNPAIVLVKTASVGGTGAVGDVVSYTFTATNTGNVTLSGVNITDALTGSTALALSPAVLAPGASGTATASYTIRQSDIDAGKVSNTATVTGTAPDASTVSDVSGTAQNNDTPTDVPLSRNPAIALVKTAAVSGDGLTISYSFVATNTGNVTLSGVNITDALTGSTALALSPAVLAPGASGTATASYTIRQSDIDAGKVSNTATVTGTAPDASTVSDVSGTAQNNDTPTNTSLNRNPAIALVKTAAVSGDGLTISYSFVATNTGNVTLSGVNITDALTGSTALALSPAVLA
ncbi:putative repeat protein (TIGR01451 family), partial [Pedobacter sp. AK013]|uniref:DUF7507 domain-containing protein n=1 Tax=Pedobacter sp. AK013 TaxID=2723071 RepID=UPI0018268F90